MATITVRTPAGAEVGDIELADEIFGVQPHVPVMHQVVTAQLATRRAGTQSTKTRAEVRGGGAKPFRQKGTGRARAGSSRAPHWTGGGVALGPKPRSYAQRTPKKMIRLALRSALSDRAADGKVVVVDGWGFDAPSTQQAAALLTALGLEGRIVVVVSSEDAVAIKSFRNLPYVHLLEPGELNAYDVLVSDHLVFTRETLPKSEPDAAKPKATKAPTAKKAPATAKAPAATKATKAAKATDAAISESEGDTDMTDLPNRPKNTGEASKPVDPSERVKPAGEKTDPRFEAARVKAEKEAEVRAAREQAANEPEADEPADEAAVTEGGESSTSGGFSFNQTAQSDEDES
jgi:large subunit ribosomal protein L4